MEALNHPYCPEELMADHDGLSQWTDCVSTNLPHLSKPQATVLALWSFGIACTRSCGRSTVATLLALLLNGQHRSLEGLAHDIVPAVMAPVLEECFAEGEKYAKRNS